MKRFFIQFAVTGLGLLGIITLFVVLIDPFYHYHGPQFGTSAYLHNQVYQSPGIIDNFEYDSAIVGTSMTENFRISWFNEYGYNTQKISYAGARTREIQTLLNKIFDKNSDIKLIFSEIEAYQLVENPDSRFAEEPTYLYDDYIYNDVKYWWNADVLWLACARVIEAVRGVEHDIDDAYTWEDAELFSKDRVLENIGDELRRLEDERGNYSDKDIDMEQVYAIADTNIANYTDIFESHPDTQFIFYFPPYSSLYWYENVLTNDNYILEVYEYAANKLISYPNVHVFYFQDEFEWIENIDNYRDECHHSPEINRMILDKIMAGEKEIDENNIQEYFDGMRKWINEYNFESIWD